MRDPNDSQTGELPLDHDDFELPAPCPLRDSDEPCEGCQ